MVRLKHSAILVAGTVSLGLFASLCAADEPIVLVENGQARATIVYGHKNCLENKIVDCSR